MKEENSFLNEKLEEMKKKCKDLSTELVELKEENAQSLAVFKEKQKEAIVDFEEKYKQSQNEIDSLKQRLQNHESKYNGISVASFFNSRNCKKFYWERSLLLWPFILQ